MLQLAEHNTRHGIITPAPRAALPAPCRDGAPGPPATCACGSSEGRTGRCGEHGRASQCLPQKQRVAGCPSS